MSSFFSKMMVKAEEAAQKAADTAAASSSSSSASGRGKGGWTRSFGGVEFVLEMSPEATARANKRGEENARTYGRAFRPCVVGIILGFIGTSTQTTFVCEDGKAAVLLCNDNNGSKVYRVGDEYKITPWGAPKVDTNGIVVVRPYAKKDKCYTETKPNRFSGYREFLTYDSVSEESQKQVIPADQWTADHAYNVAKRLGCTLRPVDPESVPTYEVWSAYADHESDGRFSEMMAGPSIEEMAARGHELQMKLEGLPESERRGVSKAFDEEMRELKKQAAEASSGMRKSAQYESWKNGIALGLPYSQWCRSFWPVYATEYSRPDGGFVGTTTPIIATGPDGPFINPSAKFFADHSDMPYNTVPAQREGEQPSKVAVVPHVCIKVSQDVLFAGAPDESGERETDAVKLEYSLWSRKLAPLLNCYMPHTLNNLAHAHLADFHIHISAQADICKTIEDQPPAFRTEPHPVTGRPCTTLHMDPYTLHASPINFALEHGYELNTRAAINVINRFLAAIGEKASNPNMANTSAFGRTNMADPANAVCHADYRRALKYVVSARSKDGGNDAVANYFEQSCMLACGEEALSEETAFFLVPARAFAPGEFGIIGDAGRKQRIRVLYRKVYVDREAEPATLEKPVDCISKWVLDGADDKFAMPPVFMEDGWATNFLLLGIPRTLLYPSDAVHAAAQETTAKYTELLVEAHEKSPHAKTRFFHHTIEGAFDALAEGGRNFSIRSHRDIQFHKELLARHFNKRQRTATFDTMGDDEGLEAAMLEAAAQAEAEAESAAKRQRTETADESADASTDEAADSGADSE